MFETLPKPLPLLVMAVLLLLSAVVGAEAAAPKPSFDCRKARTAAETAICRDPALAAVDRRIDRRFAALMKALPAHVRRALAGDQQRFLAVRDAVAENPGLLSPGLTLLDVMGEREAFLDRIQTDPPAGLVGTWGDFEGEFEIRPAPNGALRFYGTSTEPVLASWTCLFDGVGTVREDTLGFTDAGDPNWFMDLTRDGPALQLTETDAGGNAIPSPYCGKYQAFTSTYFRTGPIPDSEPEDR